MAQSAPISERTQSTVRAMTDAQLQEYRTAIEVEHRRRSSRQVSEDVPEKDRDKQALYTAVCTAVSIASGDINRKTAPLFVFLRNDQNKRELNACRAYMAALELRVMGDEPLVLNDRIKLYQTFANLTCRHLSGVPGLLMLHERMVLKQHAKFASILNNAYPGYGMTKPGWQLLFCGRRLKYEEATPD